MPELPDVTIYVEALRERLLGHTLQRVLIRGPFLLRTVSPPVESLQGKQVLEVRRLGKRICIGLEQDLWLALHLMIAGRLHWRNAAPKATAKNFLAAFEFDNGTLTLTEAGSQRRAALHVVAGEDGLRTLDAGGLEVLEAGIDEFGRVLQSSNHTLKRALTDPRLFSGIGNAYSDEILHRARLSPVAMTQKLAPEQIGKLYDAIRETLTDWVDRLRSETGEAFPEKVTAFRPSMAVHGRYRAALSALRRQGPAHPLRFQRNQLLRALPDGRTAAGRPRLVAATQAGLAAEFGRTGRAEEALTGAVNGFME